MTLTEMRRILAEGDIRLTKSLGQNFLHDQNQLRRMVALAELKAGDQVLEIGPGLGPLTEKLLETGAKVLAVEKDARLADWLRERLGGAARLALVADDGLEWLRRESRDLSSWKVVANLPYSVASPLLVELAGLPARPERMVVTLQLEVARRLMAGPGSRDYGILSLLIQLDYEADAWHKIPASCFFPAPKVDSACLRLRRRLKPLATEAERQIFVELVKRGFSQRRKMLFNLLRQKWPREKLETAFGGLGIAQNARAETLGLEQFLELGRALGQGRDT